MKENLNKTLNILIILAIIFVFATVCFHFVKNDSGSEKYKKGLEFFEDEDYQNAYYNFVRVPNKSKYYSVALFRQGMSAEKLGDNEIQAHKYEEYAKSYDNALTTEAAFKSGLAYFNNEQYSNALKMFKKAAKEDVLADKEPSKYSVAANYYIGEIEKDKNQKNAISYYLKYLEKISDGRYSKQAAQAVDDILQTNKSINLSQNQNFYTAAAFYYAGEYAKAQEFFDKITEPTGWYLKAENYIKLNKNTEALDILQTGITKYYKGVPSEKLSEAMNNFVSLYSSNHQEGWGILRDLLVGSDFPQADEIYFNLGDYETIYLNNMKGAYAPKALSKMFFDAYNKKNYTLARVYASHYLERFPDSALAAKILYYLGCCYERVFKKTEATQAYNRLRVNYPDTFWAFRAYSKTNSGKSELAKWADISYMKIDVHKKTPKFPYSQVVLNKTNAILLNDLIKLQDYELIEKIEPDNLALKSWTNYMSGNYSLSIVNARDYLNSMVHKPDFQDDLYILAYPIMYYEEINRFSELNNLNAFLMEALIREESYFNPKAKSAVGALGLMQLMPATADFIAQKSVPKEQLFEPSYNIALGTKYYRHVKNTLGNNNVYAVLAYNGGPGAVQRWIDRHQGEQIDDFIEKIPFDETQNYIFKVYRSYWNYLNIYKPDEL